MKLNLTVICWGVRLRIIRSTREYWLAFFTGHFTMVVAGRTTCFNGEGGIILEKRQWSPESFPKESSHRKHKLSPDFNDIINIYKEIWGQERSEE
ncbi:hypothetical protein MNQ98_05935 [Paenibacillus sp. N3/727]|uniref:hypothetical protein n=1 Tax=Paenibacillus sp. N3/727 TaxID=2925845 RepID=UPI001F53D378|nr:hypothetical protein [Paenibacillus sp. N3/727]UNK19569.1 hypothetical protein MNQ98_05935 [Paenibacillus sp. N3/727]